MEPIKELEKEFTKNKEVFTQVGYNPETEVYIYKREFPRGAIVFEVFKRRVNRRFNCVSYPSNEAFGYWAMTFPKYETALPYMDGIWIKTRLTHFEVSKNDKQDSDDSEYHKNKLSK